MTLSHTGRSVIPEHLLRTGEVSPHLSFQSCSRRYKCCILLGACKFKTFSCCCFGTWGGQSQSQSAVHMKRPWTEFQMLQDYSHCVNGGLVLVCCALTLPCTGFNNTAAVDSSVFLLVRGHCPILTVNN